MPFSITAKQHGLLGPYQATGAWVLRSWATANSDALERYLAAYIESLRIALDPPNRTECVALLAKWLKITPEVAGQTYDLLCEPRFGLTPDAKFDVVGFENLLALRAEIEGAWGGKAPAAERYYDLSYYERALKRVTK